MRACRVHVGGVVQGVGFRPWVWKQAVARGLSGWVRNDSSGVEIAVEGGADQVDDFVEAMRGGGPPLASVDSVVRTEREPAGLRGFEILESTREAGAYLPVSPDIAVCEDCLREMWEPGDRRFRYPFINCTNCGPRFTIVRDIPYDRPSTTMSGFPMCAKCRAEYECPGDRRFHAQPIACPECGPRLGLVRDGERVAEGEAALGMARETLARGGIVAVKGLGGYHLACDAANLAAVDRLRAGKRREAKPFALMARDEAEADRCVLLDGHGRKLLRSRERPVVLAPAQPDSAVAPGVAPGRDQLGLMLPYTPLHHLLLERATGFPAVLVMTSANLSDEPIAYRDDDAAARLGGFVDAFLVHDRAIHMRTDDSVVGAFRGRTIFYRRSRGYAPLPVRLPEEFASVPPVLGAGGEMKNAFCLTRDGRAFMSHHIGEMGHVESQRSFVEGLEHFERLFRIEPGVVAHDLHPDYACTRAALARASRGNLPTEPVQHHHAHIASCMAESGVALDRRVIGVAFDGTGLGEDGAIWGGEFLVCGYPSYERAARLRYVPLPGGDAATRRPYRVALSWLREAGVPWGEDLPPVREAGPEELAVLAGQLRAGINAPQTSSIGRLFDAVAALIGLRQRVTYEGQAAAELEAAARRGRADPGLYEFPLVGGEIDARPAIRAIVEDLRRGVSCASVARRFHSGLASMVVACCGQIAARTRLGEVALSGGTWQNMHLLREVVSGLEGAGFRVLVHHQVPANDGGLALGQVAVALARGLRSR